MAEEKAPDGQTKVALPRRRLRCKMPAPWFESPCEAGRSSASSSASASPRGEKRTRESCQSFLLRETHPDYVVVQSALDPELLEKVSQFLKRKRPRAAKMKNEGTASDDERKARYSDRDSKVSWFNAQEQCPVLHDQVVRLVEEVGNVQWPLLKADFAGRPTCTYEETQFTVYGPGQHFQAWHQDAYAEGNDPEDARQLTIVIMLTARSAYRGGHFEVKVPGPNTRKVVRKPLLEAGDAILFPAKRLLHRVSPVQTGIRKTLVTWANDKSSCRYHNAALRT